MTTLSQTLAAGATLEVVMTGDFFRLIAATAGVDVRYYRNGSEVASAEGMEAGYAERVAGGFTGIRLTNPGAGANAVKIVMRQGGDVSYDRSAGTVTVDVLAPSRFVGANAQKTVANVAAELVAANTARSYLLIQNNDSAGIVYVNFGGVATAANGVKIAPGGSYELNCNVPTAAVSAIGSIASNVNVVVVEG